MSKKETHSYAWASQQAYHSADFIRVEWNQNLIQLLELYRLPLDWNFIPHKKLTVVSLTSNKTNDVPQQEQIVWTHSDTINNVRDYYVRNHFDQDLNLHFKVTLLDPYEYEGQKLLVLLFSNDLVINQNFKIFIDSEKGFVGGVDVDDSTSNYFAVEEFKNIIRKYYLEFDWW